MPRHFTLLSVLALVTALPLAHAVAQTDAKSVEGEIRKLVGSLEESFNRGDAKGLAACWTPDGEFTGPRGERIEGREAIEAAFHEFLAAHKTAKLQMNPTSWRLVADDVALVELVPVVTPVSEGVESEPSASAVLVKREGRWLIGSMRESNTGEPSHYLHLKNLQWMVGDWVAKGDGDSAVSVRSTCDWTTSGNYLIRKFTAERRKGVLSAGTEVIGWDPRTRRVRSWTFDADGGFGESTWTQDADRWIVKHVGTLADGSDVSGTHVVTVVDPNTLTVQSMDRTLNGAKRPDLPEIKLQRASVSGEGKPKATDSPESPGQLLP